HSDGHYRRSSRDRARAASLAAGGRRTAGGTGERVVHEPRVPRGPTTRSEQSERRGRWGGCGEGASRSPGQDPRPLTISALARRRGRVARGVMVAAPALVAG